MIFVIKFAITKIFFGIWVLFCLYYVQCDLLSQYPPSIAGNLLIWSSVPYASLDPSVVSEVWYINYVGVSVNMPHPLK